MNTDITDGLLRIWFESISVVRTGFTTMDQFIQLMNL